MRLPPPQPISCRSSGISAFVPSAQIPPESTPLRLRPTFCSLPTSTARNKLGCVNVQMCLTKLHLKLVLPPSCRKLFRELVRQNCTLERGGRKETKNLLIAVQRTSSEVTKSNVTTSFSSLLAKRLSLKRTYARRL